MRDDYINEEVKKGNPDVRARIARIEMLPPPSKEDVFNLIDTRDRNYDRKRDRSRSKSKSKSPEGRAGAPQQPGFSDRKNSRSRLDLFAAADADAQSNYSGKVQRLLNNPSQAALRNDDSYFDG